MPLCIVNKGEDKDDMIHIFCFLEPLFDEGEHYELFYDGKSVQRLDSEISQGLLRWDFNLYPNPILITVFYFSRSFNLTLFVQRPA